MQESLGGLVKIENSPIRDAYLLLGANSPGELYDKYLEQDQILFKSGAWDYNNPELIVNKIKDVLEKIGIENLSGKEKVWVNEILWFWNHHAISIAIGKYHDIEKAKDYAEEALKYQSNDLKHPNKITKLLFYLVNDKLEEAEKFAKDEIEEDEKEAATLLIESYKNNWGGY